MPSRSRYGKRGNRSGGFGTEGREYESIDVGLGWDGIVWRGLTGTRQDCLIGLEKSHDAS